jgi:hypothetical protein
MSIKQNTSLRHGGEAESTVDYWGLDIDNFFNFWSDEFCFIFIFYQGLVHLPTREFHFDRAHINPSFGTWAQEYLIWVDAGCHFL